MCNVHATCLHRALYRGRVPQHRSRREQGEPWGPKGTNDEGGNREGVGMPRTMLCTVRVQGEGAGEETKTVHEGVGSPARVVMSPHSDLA